MPPHLHVRELDTVTLRSLREREQRRIPREKVEGGADVHELRRTAAVVHAASLTRNVDDHEAGDVPVQLQNETLPVALGPPLARVLIRIVKVAAREEVHIPSSDEDVLIHTNEGIECLGPDAVDRMVKVVRVR
jgi:hypothetical protein